jgi:hypothetical protein
VTCPVFFLIRVRHDSILKNRISFVVRSHPELTACRSSRVLILVRAY